MKSMLEIKAVSKCFSISHKQLPYLTFRETLVNIFKSKEQKEILWALRDITFDMPEGEIMGIIGKNGSGKSTLLKVLSKITPPTAGKIIIRGRIASLLEVGTGFHPELTGMENIYLNGAILGMKKREIKSKIDEIIAFSEVEQFLDTPLKRYSSGMKLKLAFSVAAFLEPEILIIDEVLGVGDIEFQKKCIKKMKDEQLKGRTVLFVSHNLQSIAEICTTAALLEKGQLKKLASTQETIAAYVKDQSAFNASDRAGEYIFDTPQKDSFITKIICLCDDTITNICYPGCSWAIQVYFKANIPLTDPVLQFILHDSFGTAILDINNKNYINQIVQKPIKAGVLSLQIPNFPLIDGIYTIDIHLSDRNVVLDSKRNVIQLNVKQNHIASPHEPINHRVNKFFFKNLIWKAEDRS